MIKFKVIPVLDNKYLIKNQDINSDSFLTFELTQLDHVKELKDKLMLMFHTDFLIGRSFQILNDQDDIIIYTFVHPRFDFVQSGYSWKDKNSLIPMKFDEFDRIAVRNILANF